jgi:hypothetical protein
LSDQCASDKRVKWLLSSYSTNFNTSRHTTPSPVTTRVHWAWALVGQGCCRRSSAFMLTNLLSDCFNPNACNESLLISMCQCHDPMKVTVRCIFKWNTISIIVSGHSSSGIRSEWWLRDLKLLCRCLVQHPLTMASPTPILLPQIDQGNTLGAIFIGAIFAAM